MTKKNTLQNGDSHEGECKGWTREETISDQTEHPIVKYTEMAYFKNTQASMQQQSSNNSE